MIYLATLLIAQTKQCRMLGRSLSNVLESMSKNGVVAYFKLVSRGFV
jgi:hypothetical protein